MRDFRLDAPTFDGYDDPKAYLNWERNMDQYFEEDLMTEKRKFQFAKLKLVRQARLYWGNVERLIRDQGEIPIDTWSDMKIRLREKYVPIAYHQRLFDQVYDPNPRRAYHDPDYEPHPRRSYYHDPEYNQWCYEQRLLD